MKQFQDMPQMVEGKEHKGHFQDRDLLLEFTTVGPHPVHKVSSYHFRMVHAESRVHVGNINLRVGSNVHIERYAGHIGFTVFAAYRGRHYASRALSLLLPLAHQLGLNPLWITCDPDNIASRRSCELAGAKFVDIVDVPETCIIHRMGHPQKCRYRINTRNAG